MTPSRDDEESASGCGVEFCADAAEQIRQASAQGCCGKDDANGDQRGNQAVFNRSGTGIVFENKAFNEFQGKVSQSRPAMKALRVLQYQEDWQLYLNQTRYFETRKLLRLCAMALNADERSVPVFAWKKYEVEVAQSLNLFNAVVLPARSNPTV